MADALVPAALEHVEVADDVRFDVGARVLDGVAHPGLGGEVDHDAETVVREQGRHPRFAREIHLGELEARVVVEDDQALLFEGRVVVVVQVVHADDAAAFVEEALGEVEADETGGAGDEDGFVQEIGHWGGVSLSEGV